MSTEIESRTLAVMQAAQIRAARALLGWRQEDLAKAAKVGLATIARIEQGEGMVQGNFARAGGDQLYRRTGGRGWRAAAEEAPARLVLISRNEAKFICSETGKRGDRGFAK